MMKRSIYITSTLPLEVFNLFKEEYETEMHSGPRLLPKAELLEKLKPRDAILVVSTKIDDEICGAIKDRCRILANYGVGYNNIDVEAATKNGVYVTNTPDVVTAATADLTWALLLGTARRVVESDKFVRSGDKGWGPTILMGAQVCGKTLGIIGGGRIGLAVGKRARGFDMKVIYTDVQPSQVFEATTGGIFVDKQTLLKTADFITIHTPLLAATRHLIDANALNLMKKTAILVNASRGPVVDEKALVKALQEGVIRGAGLDVFENEPDLEPGLAELPNVVLMPHLGTQTLDTRVEMGMLCAKNISAALAGQVPSNCLNPEAAANRSQFR